MNLKRPNKILLDQMRLIVKPMLCPIHSKAATINMECENEEVQVEACCTFFKKDVAIIVERMRKDFLYRDGKTRERLERERLRAKRGGNN